MSPILTYPHIPAAVQHMHSLMLSLLLLTPEPELMILGWSTHITAATVGNLLQEKGLARGGLQVLVLSWYIHVVLVALCSAVGLLQLLPGTCAAHFLPLSLPLLLLLSEPEVDDPPLLLLLSLLLLLTLLGGALRLGGGGLSCRARFARLSGSGRPRAGRSGERASRRSGRLLRSASRPYERSPLRLSLLLPSLLAAFLKSAHAL